MKIYETYNQILLVDFMYVWNCTWYANKGKSSKMFHYMKSIVRNMTSPNSGYNEVWFILDGSNSTASRKAIYEGYKANRDEDTKKEVYERVDEFLALMDELYSEDYKVKFIRSENHEADDVIAAICQSGGANYYIFSGDKDLMQLAKYEYVGICKTNHMFIDFNAKTLPAGTFPRYKNSEILAKYSSALKVPITNISDIIKYKTFRGDMSDNIPSAVRNLKAKSIKELIDNCWVGEVPMSDEVFNSMVDYADDKLKERLVEHKNNIYRNWKLMQLVDVDVNSVITSMKIA